MTVWSIMIVQSGWQWYFVILGWMIVRYILASSAASLAGRWDWCITIQWVTLFCWIKQATHMAQAAGVLSTRKPNYWKASHRKSLFAPHLDPVHKVLFNVGKVVRIAFVELKLISPWGWLRLLVDLAPLGNERRVDLKNRCSLILHHVLLLHHFLNLGVNLHLVAGQIAMTAACDNHPLGNASMVEPTMVNGIKNHCRTSWEGGGVKSWDGTLLRLWGCVCFVFVWLVPISLRVFNIRANMYFCIEPLLHQSFRRKWDT